MKQNENPAPKQGKFNSLVGFFRELKHPKEKCNRIGHNENVRTERIRREAKDSYYVVEDFKADIVKCRRCGETLRIENEQKCASYTGCSMPSSMWDEMRANGYCIV